MPAGHDSACCAAQVTETGVPYDEVVADEAKVPAGHVEQTRSAVGVDAAERNVPAGHVTPCAKGQVEATGTCEVEGAAALAKVPGLQPVQARSAVVLAAAE